MNERVNEEASFFTLSAALIGFLLIPELTAKQQNDFGNWLMLVGQVLCTNAARIAILKANDPSSDSSSQEMIQTLEHAIEVMQQEIADLKEKVNKTT